MRGRMSRFPWLTAAPVAVMLWLVCAEVFAEDAAPTSAPTTTQAAATSRSAAAPAASPRVSHDHLMSPVAFAVFAAWLAACLYCTTWAQQNLSMPAERKALINWLLLLTGPVGLAVVWYIQRNPRLREQVSELLGRIVPHRATGEPQEKVRAVELVLCNSDGTPVGSLGSRKAFAHDSLELAKRIIHEALDRRASDVLIDPRSGDVHLVRYRIDGILQEVARLPADEGVAVVNCFKVASRLDISERRRPQDGAFLAKLGDREIKLRSATAGTLYGEKMAIRIFDTQAGLISLDNVGMNDLEQQQIRQFVERSDGMILVAGPTGSGKTTSIYAALNLLAGKGRNIVTIEQPIEYPLPYASQTEVNPKAGITFAAGLRSMMRQDPDVILVGEIRDRETAETALQASQTGHLVLSTIHSNDGLTALARLVEFGIEPFLISTSLTAVLSQRLVRTLCPHCKEAANISQKLRREGAKRQIALGKVCVASGCEECEGTGYVGRTGIFEILPLSKEMGQLLTLRPSLGTIQAQAQKEGLVTMRQRGIEKVLQGVTTADEVVRVTT